MRKRLLVLIISSLCCGFTYGFKNNDRTGKSDMVVTGVTTGDVVTSLNGVLYGNGLFISTATNAQLPTMTATVGGAVPTPPNNTTTYLRGDATFAVPPGTYTLPTATSSVLGGVKPDGVSILNTAGVLSATAASVGALAIGAQSADSAKLGGTAAATVISGAAAGATAVQPVGAWTPYATTIGAPGGTLTTATASMRYVQQGKLIYFTADFDITNKGTANGITLTIPVAANSTPAYAGSASGRDRALDSKTVTGVIAASQGKIYFAYYDGTSCAVNGAGFSVSGIYEAQ